MQTRNKTYARSLIPFSAKCLSAVFLVFVLTAIDISAQTFTFSNTSTITINSSGAASPAPSTINVGMSGQIVNATVTLKGLSHARPDDIGVVLVSPTNKKIRLMTDNGGSTLVTLADVTFDDRVSASLSDNAGIPSGTYKPSLGASGSSGDGNTHGADIASAPASPYSLLLSDLDGDDAMGTWSLYVDDDTSPTTGSILSGWTLNLTLGYAYTNPSPISIPGTGTGPAAAAPYASNILVSGVPGGVTNVRVRLINLSHTWPDDIGVVLVGPLGQKVRLMIDNGGGDSGGESITGRFLKFDDAAANSLPDDASIISGTYKPSFGTVAGGGNVHPANMAAGAPAGPYDATLASFNGLNPNGVWSLFVDDDSNADVGSIAGGWMLELQMLGPSAAPANLSGRVVTTSGIGISKATVILWDAGIDGPRYAVTGPFGNYTFADVVTGRNYILSVSAKRYAFAEPVRLVNFGDELTNVDFVASP